MQSRVVFIVESDRGRRERIARHCLLAIQFERFVQQLIEGYVVPLTNGAIGKRRGCLAR